MHDSIISYEKKIKYFFQEEKQESDVLLLNRKIFKIYHLNHKI
jgi:hypothetical protein